MKRLFVLKRNKLMAKINLYIRNWTTQELEDRFPEKHGLICPGCLSTKFQPGPRGGNSQNYRCENDHTWNVSAFGMDYLP